MKKVAVLQSNYIPWKGYFEIIKEVDEFIILMMSSIPKMIGGIGIRFFLEKVYNG